MTTPDTQSPTSHVPGPARRQWRDPSERGTQAVRGDEFDADVARALAALRQQHGHSNVSCQSDGNQPSELALLREELSAVLPGVNRRGFMQLTGAAAVFALAGCYKKHPDTIVPYAQQPEGTVLGKPVFYSSTLRDSGRPVSVMVKTYDGRPIKIEGNPDHPLTRGACDARTQASLLNLYDPDRFQNGPQKRSGKELTATSWKNLDEAVGAALKGGGKVGLITAPIDGLADRALLAEYRQLLGDRLLHGIHDPLADAAGAAVYHVDRAAVLLTIGSDFLGGGATGLTEMVEFGDFRRLRGNDAQADLGQVIAFEATMSQIGASADVRVRVSPDRFAHVGWGIAEAVSKAVGVALPAGVAEALAKVAGGKPLATALDLRAVAGIDAIEFAAQQLVAAKKVGRNSLVYVGGFAADAGAADAADFLNAALGNVGVTVDAHAAIVQVTGSDVLLAAARGELSTLIVVDVNPAYSLVAAKELIEGIEKVKTVVVLADRPHETARLAHYVAPTLHGLESWGDAEARPGVHSLQQPCIQPLWDARAWQESLMAFMVAAGVPQTTFKQPVVAVDAKHPPLSVASAKPLWIAAANGVQSWQAYVKAVWLTQVKAKAGITTDDRAFWNGALARGVVVVPTAKSVVPAYSAPKGAVSLPALKPAGALSLVISASRVMGDGTWLNNAWLQELPDPVSKVTWDNYVALSAKDAKERDIKANDVVKLSVGKIAVNLPVHIQEGQQPGVVETFLGWGRAKDCAGQVANFCIEHGMSVNAAVLIGDAASIVAIEKTGETYRLANMQGHNRMEGRDIAIDDVLELHRADPGRKHRGNAHALWNAGTDGKAHGRLSLFGKEHDYVGHKWGMTVDLGSCTGCNACVVACNAENNVPVVGRDEVRKGREMHWIRIDRYYSSPGDDTDMLDVEVIQQPVMCQQCGNAPCEEACPAMATMHNDEGVNVMVYNRCIGTRYCSNNCPYKVRRFNWYEYGKYRFGPQASQEPLGRIVRNVISDGATSSQAELNQHPLQMLLNPEVTVRSRGVMEKCNFCIQRTRDIRDQEKATNSRLPDGKVTTACAQTCPTKAIVFGDRNDPESAVNRVMAEKHAYQLLDSELNTRPAVSYLAKVRNRPATADERQALVAAEAHPAKAKPEGAH